MVILYEHMLRNINQRTMKISNLIERLIRVQNSEGDLDVYIWSDGIAKMPNHVTKIEGRSGFSGDPISGCFIEL